MTGQIEDKIHEGHHRSIIIECICISNIEMFFNLVGEMLLCDMGDADVIIIIYIKKMNVILDLF